MGQLHGSRGPGHLQVGLSPPAHPPASGALLTTPSGHRWCVFTSLASEQGPRNPGTVTIGDSLPQSRDPSGAEYPLFPGAAGCGRGGSWAPLYTMSPCVHRAPRSGSSCLFTSSTRWATRSPSPRWSSPRPSSWASGKGAASA